MNKMVEKIRSHKLFRQSRRYLENIDVVQGSITMYQFLKLFARKVNQDDIWEKANAIAFSFTLSLFPAIIFLFTLIPYVQYVYEPLNQEAIMLFFEEIFPPSVYDFTSQTIEDIISKSRGGLLTFGFLTSTFLATAGMMSIIKAFNACYQTKETRGWLRTRLMATGLTGVLAMTLLVSTLSLTVGEALINQFYPRKLLDSYYIIYLIYVLRFVIVFILFFVVIATLYYFAPAVKDRWHFFSWGATLASLLTVLISFAFSLYINNFGTYNKLYGSIGALIAVMVWFYILAVIILLGFELNATLDRAKVIGQGEATREEIF
jgi:membrane protein